MKKFLAVPERTKILTDFMGVFGLRLLQMALSFGVSYVLVRSLSPEQFGQYHYVLGWFGALSIFALPGLLDSVMQAVARGKLGTYHAGLRLSFHYSLIGSCILAGLSIHSLFFNADWELGVGFALMALAFPFVHGLVMWKSLQQGLARFKLLTLTEALSSGGVSLITICGSLLLPGQLFVPLLSIGLVMGAVNIVQTLFALKQTQGTQSDVEDGNIAFGIKTTLYSILSVLANHIDKILLFQFLSPVSLAMFMAGQKLSEPVQSVTQDLAAVLAPRLAQYTSFSRDLDWWFTLYSIIMGILITCFTFTLLEPIYLFIFGAQYAAGLPVCQALMISLVFGNVASLRFRFIRSRMSEQSVRNVILVNSILRIGASFIFIPLYGIWGAVIAVFVTRVGLVIQIHFDIKKFR